MNSNYAIHIFKKNPYKKDSEYIGEEVFLHDVATGEKKKGHIEHIMDFGEDEILYPFIKLYNGMGLQEFRDSRKQRKLKKIKVCLVNLNLDV